VTETTGDMDKFNVTDEQLSCEILLDPEVLRALYRRGRRRLRDIQASSQAILKLDRLRGVLKVVGSKESIADAQRQLDCVVGSHLDVSPVMWAELMRTRTNPDVSQAAIAQIQHSSGCRIHIERNDHQVQLFGPQNKSAVAQHLLKKLESMCTEKVVNIEGHVNLEALHMFAEEFGVTLQVEETNITIMGIEGAVVEAAKEIHNYDFDKAHLGQSNHMSESSDVACAAISAAISRLFVDPESDFSPPTPYPMAHSLQTGVCTQTSESAMQGAVMMKKAGSISQQKMVHPEPCPTCGGIGTFCVNCGKPAGRMMQQPFAGCSTCGLANFCAYCGEPAEKMQIESTGGMQQQVFASNYKPGNTNAKPGMYCADPIPVMPMQFVQPRVYTSSSQQTIMPMAKCIALTGQQGFQVLAGMSPLGSPIGMQAGPTMLLSPTHGIQDMRCMGA